MLQALIIDDEDLARLRLRGLVHDCLDPKAEVVGEAANAGQALAWLAEHTCDLVLLDVQMPGRDGLQLAAELRRLPQPPAIVFVTAHPQHAVQAFDLEAIDYLTKPVRRERLQAALQRVAQRRALQQAPPPSSERPEIPVIVISDRGRVLRLPVAEVLYLKAELKYVTLRTALHTHVLDESLSELEARLGDHFLRVHRNALVARSAVRALERRVLAPPADAAAGDEDNSGEVWAVCMEPIGEWLAVSRRQVVAVREALVNR